LASLYLVGSTPFTFVRDLLGHESLATTEIYTQLADEMAKGITFNTEMALDRLEDWDAFYTKPHIVRLDSDAAFPSVRSTSGLRWIVSFGGEPAAVPDHAILVSTSWYR
jgi:hypothetical protein